MLEVCPGHALDRRILYGARRTFRQLERVDFLETAREVALAAAPLPENPFAVFGAESLESRMYARLADAGNWAGADKMYMDWIKTRYPGLYRATLDGEGLAREFNAVLVKEMRRSTFIVRWMDMEELPSYLNGTFESRIEEGRGRRGYKAFSLGENIHADKRPASLTVPMDGAIRRALRTATYTALPRLVPPEDERLWTRKHVANAHETECRLPDGIRVPPGTRIAIKHSMADPPRYSKMHSVLERLKGTAEISLV